MRPLVEILVENSFKNWEKLLRRGKDNQQPSQSLIGRFNGHRKHYTVEKILYRKRVE